MGYILKYFIQEELFEPYDNYQLVLINNNKVQKVSLQNFNKNKRLNKVNIPINLESQTNIKIYGLKNKTITLLYTSDSTIYDMINRNTISLNRVFTPELVYNDNNYFLESFINCNCFTKNSDKVYLFIGKGIKSVTNQRINTTNMIYYPYDNTYYYENGCKKQGICNKIYIDKVNYNTIISVIQGIILNKSYFSFITRDMQQMVMPQDGELVDIKYNGSSTILTFYNEYFIPKSIMERDLASVHNGNYTYAGVGVGIGNRNYPERIAKQPDTVLIFYIIINERINVSKKFYYQGSFLATINANVTIDLIFNRDISFKKKISRTNNTFIEKYDLIGSIE